jgi:hypothetical protein
VTAARGPNVSNPGFVVAEPVRQGDAADGSVEAARGPLDGPAGEQPMAMAAQPTAIPADDMLGEIQDRIAGALAARTDGAGALAPDIQRELAQLLGLLPLIAASGDRFLIGSVKLALSCLLENNSNVVFARETRLNIAQRLGIYPSLRWALTSSPIPAVRVMTGLICVLAVAIPVLGITVILLRAHIAHLASGNMDLDDLILYGIFGAAGSVVSIMVRIDEFNRWPQDPSILFFTGLFKPIIGFFFAMFVLLALNSGIVQITIAEDRQAYFFMAISFIAGFSERLARDIATQTESLFPGAGGQPAAPPAEQPAESRRKDAQ